MYGGHTVFVHYCGNNLSLKSYVLPRNPASSKCIFCCYLSINTFRGLCDVMKKAVRGCENYNLLDIFMYRIMSFHYYFLVVFVEIVTSEKLKILKNRLHRV